MNIIHIAFCSTGSNCEIKEYPTVIRFIIGNDKGRIFTPFNQFYIYYKDDITAHDYATKSICSFAEQWNDINSSAPLVEITNEILISHKITAGPWIPEFKEKSFCSPKQFHLPQYVIEAKQALEKFEKLLQDEWVNISTLDYQHTNDIILDGDVFDIGDAETWRGYKLSDLIEQSKHIDLAVRLTSDRGYGLFTHSYIPKDTIICEYTGELLDVDVALERDDQTYQFWCGPEYRIDAKFKGNYSRFINHICDGRHSACNIAVDLIEDTGLEGFFRIVIYSKRNINPGTELLYNYRSGVVKSLTGKNGHELQNKILCHCPCTNFHINYPFVF